MDIKKPLLLNVIQIIKDEFTKSKGINKFLLLAIVVNIPAPHIFIPYVTQVFTVILLAVYLKNYPKVEPVLNESSSIENKRLLGIPLLIMGLSVLTILIQLSWVPFLTQLITITILSFLFVSSRKYLET